MADKGGKPELKPCPFCGRKAFVEQTQGTASPGASRLTCDTLRPIPAKEYMQELPESVGRMVESMYEESTGDQEAAFADLLANATKLGRRPARMCKKKYGRHVGTRTPDL